MRSKSRLIPRKPPYKARTHFRGRSMQAHWSEHKLPNRMACLRRTQLEARRHQCVGMAARRVIMDHGCDHQLVGLRGGEQRIEPCAYGCGRADEEARAVVFDTLAI